MPGYLSDFRRQLIEDYNLKKNKAIVAQKGPKFINYKPLFNNEYYDKDQCFIINNGDVSVGSIFHLLYKNGYIIDDIGINKSLTRDKIVLLSYLKNLGYRVPELSIGNRTDGMHNAKFTFSEEIDMCTNADNEELDYGCFPWDSADISCMVFYYYLGKKIATAMMVRNRSDRLFKLVTPSVKYYMVYPSSLHDTSRNRPRTLNVEETAKIDAVDEFDTDFIKSLDKIPSLLGSTSCQVTAAWNNKKPMVVNVSQTHDPYCIQLMGYDVFLEKIKNRFYEVMLNHKEV